mmetsp:Transcript_78320/g.151251  ORF Transcript_78320/g.151251 Transcript_78320/m.151251 type:complete len:97 (+) Transcript_78320:385-675(+)
MNSNLRGLPAHMYRQQHEHDKSSDGNGRYQAIVTGADDLTFTVVMVDSAGRWEETHVLKSCCILLEGEVHSFSHRKFAASASPHCKVEPCKVEPCM